MGRGTGIGLITLIMLCGCNRVAATNNVAAAPANVTAATTPPPAAGPVAANGGSAAPELTVAFLTGAWSEGGNCDRPAVAFRADGTTDGGTWALRGNQVVRTTPQGEDPPLDIRVIAQDRMAVSFAGLPEQVFTRCPG